MLGKLPRLESANVVRHLLAGCVQCQVFTNQSWARMEHALSRVVPCEQADEETSSSIRYESTLARVLTLAEEKSRLLADERMAAPFLCAELLSHPSKRQVTLVLNSRRFQTWSVCEMVLDESFERRFDDPRKGLGLAKVALELASTLDTEKYGAAPVEDLKARAWAFAGNSQRILSELRTAEDSFKKAYLCLRKGTGDPLERALCTRLHAQVALDKRQLDTAIRRFDAALLVYRGLGEESLGAQVLLSKAKAKAVAGETETSLALLDQALVAFKKLGETRLIALTRQNRARCLTDLGRHAEALAELAGIEPLYQQLGALSTARLNWSRGRILREMKELSEAEKVFLDVLTELVEQDIAYDAALVSLDLAMVYAAQGRVTEMRQLAQEMLPIFESRDVHREAMAALIIFRQAAEAERATLGLVREVAAFLEKAQTNRKLRFRSSGQ